MISITGLAICRFFLFFFDDLLGQVLEAALTSGARDLSFFRFSF